MMIMCMCMFMFVFMFMPIINHSNNYGYYHYYHCYHCYHCYYHRPAGLQLLAGQPEGILEGGLAMLERREVPLLPCRIIISITIIIVIKTTISILLLVVFVFVCLLLLYVLTAAQKLLFVFAIVIWLYVCIVVFVCLFYSCCAEVLTADAHNENFAPPRRPGSKIGGMPLYLVGGIRTIMARTCFSQTTLRSRFVDRGQADGIWVRAQVHMTRAPL